MTTKLLLVVISNVPVAANPMAILGIVFCYCSTVPILETYEF